ncbi:phage tail protein [Sphingomonas sp. BN140010]|uniref:Phage tail protein n=1 Tax=Sphingomonas arvum TaxID=2992113 RepID=A0ABT3JHV8_9SPHN|nr:phage tail protein [Sphingomonas sp. BN140010]MCW3798629.1 phage tail protein [Sphingomonas sp. BN140010]
MATLVLGGVGAALGGGIGGLIGTFVGQTIDTNILGSGRAGRSRLADLAFQSSSYGAQLPRIYGTMRVAGAVVWATDLVANIPAGGGKAPPTGGAYSYSASFAVALSSRGANRVRRIWADGKLLRGEAGDWKVPTNFRFYRGDEDQRIDPLIASIEGIDNTPAYRGISLAVFEQLQLLEFGNRIPVLTFELEADQDQPTTEYILADLSSGLIQGGASNTVAGYAGSGPTVGDALSPLLEVQQIQLAVAGEQLNASPASNLLTIQDHELGCGLEAAVPRASIRRAPSADLPTRVSLRYFDAALEYQGGQQQATWSTNARESRLIEIPAVLTASAARTSAHDLLTKIWDERETAEFKLPLTFAGARIGDRLVTSEDEQWRITGRMLESWVVHLRCCRVPGRSVPIEADAGRTIGALDRIAEPSDIVLLDLPAMNEVAGDPMISIAVSGGQQPWRALPLVLTAESMAPLELAAPARAVLGVARSRLSPGSESLFDQVNSVILELRDDDWLQNCTADDLLAGANLAALGRELLQFARVEPLGGRRFRLSQLLRGRFGTEWAMSDHREGDRFVLLRRSDLTTAGLPRVAIGRRILATGRGVGDGLAPGSAQLDFTFEACRPPAPCQLRCATTFDGGLKANWIRRSRVGYDWNDYLDAPLGEESERYLVRVGGQLGSLTKEVQAQDCFISSAELSSVGAYPFELSVVQLGTFARSHPVSINVEKRS